MVVLRGGSAPPSGGGLAPGGGAYAPAVQRSIPITDAIREANAMDFPGLNPDMTRAERDAFRAANRANRDIRVGRSGVIGVPFWTAGTVVAVVGAVVLLGAGAVLIARRRRR